MNLTAKEISLLLDALAKQHGPGYAKDKDVARLQAKLSVLLEVRQNQEEK